MAKRKNETAPTEPATPSGAGATPTVFAPVVEPGELQLIPVEQIVVDIPNREITEAVVAEREASMRVHGQKAPIIVRLRPDGRPTPGGGKYSLVDGESRLRAAQRLGMEHLNAIVWPAATAAQIQVDRLLLNSERVNFNPIAEVLAVRQLIDEVGGERGDTPAVREEVAARLGKKLWWVNDRAYLVRLCKEVAEMVARGELPLGHGREIAKLGNPADQVAIANELTHNYHHGPRESGEQKSTHCGSLEECKTLVARKSRSLKVVPWHLDTPFARKPACVGCPHNTKSDPVLFEGSGDPAVEAGTCLNEPCFEAKMLACEQAKVKVAEKFVPATSPKGKGKKAKQTSGASGGGGPVEITGTAIAQAAPAFIKKETVQRYVKKQIEQASTPGSAAGRSVGGKPKVATEAERRHGALEKYAEALREWQRVSGGAIEKTLAASIGRRIASILFRHWKRLEKATYRVDTYRWPKMPTKPNTPPTIAQEMKGAAAMVVSGTPNDHKDIVTLCGVGNAGMSALFCHFESFAPALLHHFAELLKIELKPEPEFEDFLPADLRTPGSTAAASPAKPDEKGNAKPNQKKGRKGKAASKATTLPGAGAEDEGTTEEPEDRDDDLAGDVEEAEKLEGAEA